MKVGSVSCGVVLQMHTTVVETLGSYAFDPKLV